MSATAKPGSDTDLVRGLGASHAVDYTSDVLAQSISIRTIQIISAFEVLGAIEIILPRLTGILPWLTIVAALCLALMLPMAMRLLVRRKELLDCSDQRSSVCAAVFVAVGRLWWD